MLLFTLQIFLTIRRRSLNRLRFSVLSVSAIPMQYLLNFAGNMRSWLSMAEIGE